MSMLPYKQSFCSVPRRRILCIAITSLLATSAMPAFAQTAPTQAANTAQQLDAVMITGSYSRSLERAVDIKRENPGFSDTVVATDVADFPEQNLAEALQRMPGVTIERNKGLGSRVSVRGLPSEFTHVSINDVATASGSGGRDVEFDIFASEIIQSVTVQKSPTAAHEEGGIAGSVMISTARPFDYPSRKLVGSLEAAHNSISSKTDPRISLLASDTWGDFGALVSFSHARRSNRTDSNSGINFRPMSRFLEASGVRSSQAVEVLARDAGITVDNVRNREQTNRIIFQDKVGDRVYFNEQDKTGATLSLQYRPSHRLSVSFDAMLGRFDATEDEYDAAAYTASSRSTLERIHDFDATTLASHGITVLRDVSYTATQHEFLSKERINKTDYRQYGVNLDWHLGDWRIDGLLGYSGARRSTDYANLKHVAFAPSRSRWTDRGGETIPSDTSAGFDMYTSLNRYLFEAYETTYEQVSDDKYAAQVNARRSLDFDFFPALAAVQLGARYTDKSKQRQFGDLRIQGPRAGSAEWVNTRTLADSPVQRVTDIVSGGSYRPRDLEWSQVSNEDARRIFRYDRFVTAFAPGQFYRVDEAVSSIYAMADFHFDIAQVPVFANAGVRYVDTSIKSFGYHPVQNPDGSTGFTTDPVQAKGSYSNLLPSLNAHAELMPNLLLRGAASKTLMRPALTDIAYRRSVSWSGFRFTDGNPALQPTEATQWELGIEKYLNNGGLLAASYFSKTIKGVVRNALTGVVPNVEKRNADGTLDGFYDFDVYQPVNADGSYKVTGLELVAQTPLSIFHPVLEGFGVNLNYTLLDSSLAGVSQIGVDSQPEGLADRAWNATVYYENDRFDARLSWNYKGRYVDYIHLNMYPVYRDAYRQVDMSLGYRINENLSLSLKGINMTNQRTNAYTIHPSFPLMDEYSGRRVSFGIRADF